jgi:hypothetical protein
VLRQRFLGLGNVEHKEGLSADVQIAAGRFQIVEATNSFERIAVYRKSISSCDRGEVREQKQRKGFDEHGMPSAGFEFGGKYSSSGAANMCGCSMASASNDYQNSGKSSSSSCGSSSFDMYSSTCRALGCGSGLDCDGGNGYDENPAGNQGDGYGGCAGNNGNYNNKDFGKGFNIDLDAFSSVSQTMLSLRLCIR